MNRVAGTKTVIGEIINSYQRRVETISALTQQTVQILEDSRGQQDEMTEELRDILAKTESLRKRDFDKMMEEIRGKRSQREKEVRQALENFVPAERNMINELRQSLQRKENSTIDEFVAWKEKILESQQEREGTLTHLLRSYHLEQEELSATLRNLLRKGRRVRTRQFKDMIKGLRAYRTYKEGSIGNMLSELEEVDKQVNTIWQRVAVNDQHQIVQKLKEV